MPMAKLFTSLFLIMAVLLAVFLTSVPTMVGARECRGVDEFCGGFAGFTCCDNLECKLNGDYADAGGVCVTKDCKGVDEFCGGIVGFTCCTGLKCKLEGDFPDAGGVCVQTY